MNPVETDLSIYLGEIDNATRRYDSLHQSELDDLVSDVMNGDCEKVTLASVLEGYNACDYAGLIANVCNASGDDLILARAALDKWITERVRDYCDEHDELDRRISERYESERNGNV